MSDDEWLTLVEVAALLKVSYKTIWRFTAPGRLKSYKIGNQRRVRKSDLLDFIAAEQMQIRPSRSRKKQP